VYGAEGSGKAAIASQLRSDFNFPPIFLASYLSSNVLDETPLGNKARDFVVNNKPLPQDLIFSLICDLILHNESEQGILLEDIPLSIDQVQALSKFLSPQCQFIVIDIDISEEWAIKKAQNRAICRSCGRVYNFSTPPVHNTCEVCFIPLEKRDADSSAMIQSKIQHYKDRLSSLLHWYKESDVLNELSGEKSFDELYDEVATIIETKTGLLPNQSTLPASSE
jgi:adenylate kinase